MAAMKREMESCFCSCHVWDNEIKDKKVKIESAMKSHQEISKKMAQILLLKQRVFLLQQAFTEQKKTYENICQDLELLKKSNIRKYEKCKKAKSRDFTGKVTNAQSECHHKEVTLLEERKQLLKLRQTFIGEIMNTIYPISLSSTIEDTFHYIGPASLPSDGNMKSYINAVKLKGQSTNLTSSTTSNDDITITRESLTDPILSVPAAVSFLIHSVWIISDVLDQVLPHSLLLPVALCEYGRGDKKAQSIVRFLMKLDDNIMFLAFTQNVSPQSLKVGHTLSNLSVLINHHELGRSGPFTSYPELLHYHIKKRFHEDDCTDESEPPLLHTAAITASTSSIILSNNTGDSLSSQETDYSDDNDDEPIIEGWEEVHDLMVPTTRLYHYGNRLEYGTSFSEYSHQTIINESHHQDNISSSHSSSQYSNGLLDTISSLLGSGWSKK